MSVRGSLALVFVEKYAAMAVGLGATVILARLLTPAEIGAYSVAAVVVSFAHLIRNFGLNQYLIQVPELTADLFATLFTLTLALGWLLGAVVWLLAEPLAAFYASGTVGEVMRVLAIGFLLVPFGAITLTWLRRELRFGPAVAISIVSALANLIVAVSLALAGWGALSLAWGTVASIVVTVLLSVPFRPRHLPWRMSLRGWRQALRFGGWAGAAGVTRELGEAAPDLVIGKLQDMAAVGIFGRAMGAVMLFNRLILSAVRPVTLPAFSRAARAGGDVGHAYADSVAYLSAVALPFFACLALLAEPVVRVLYGPQWGEAVPLVRVLCVWGAASSLLYLSGEALMAVGAVRRYAANHFVAQPLLLVLLIAAAPHGLLPAALAMAAAGLFAFLLSAWHVHHALGLGPRRLLRAIAPAVPLAAAAAAPAALLLHWVPQWPHALLLGASLAGGALAWLLALWLTVHPLRAELRRLMPAGRRPLQEGV